MDKKVIIRDIYDSMHKLRSNNHSYANEYIEEKMKNIPDYMLIRLWRNEKNIKIKEMFEVLIAKKLNGYNALLKYNDIPSIYLDYLYEVSYIDAIIELLDNSNETVLNIAKDKYKDFFDNYLEQSDEEKVIEFRRIV